VSKDGRHKRDAGAIAMGARGRIIMDDRGPIKIEVFAGELCPSDLMNDGARCLNRDIPALVTEPGAFEA
jgi:hypothetical protein